MIYATPCGRLTRPTIEAKVEACPLSAVRLYKLKNVYEHRKVKELIKNCVL